MSWQAAWPGVLPFYGEAQVIQRAVLPDGRRRILLLQDAREEGAVTHTYYCEVISAEEFAHSEDVRALLWPLPHATQRRNEATPEAPTAASGGSLAAGGPEERQSLATEGSGRGLVQDVRRAEAQAVPAQDSSVSDHRDLVVVDSRDASSQQSEAIFVESNGASTEGQAAEEMKQEGASEEGSENPWAAVMILMAREAGDLRHSAGLETRTFDTLHFWGSGDPRRRG